MSENGCPRCDRHLSHCTRVAIKRDDARVPTADTLNIPGKIILVTSGNGGVNFATRKPPRVSLPIQGPLHSASKNFYLLPFRNLFATAQTQQPATINSATTHAVAWHSQHKKSIQQVSTTYLLGCPEVTMEFGRIFFFFILTKKCAKFHCYPRAP